MTQKTSEETDTLIHIRKPRDVSAITEMHARGFGKSRINCERAEERGRQERSWEARKRNKACTGMAVSGCPLPSSGFS